MGPLAIIPVKAKSSRLPGKNMKDFLGKPLYEHSVWAAIESGIFEKIVITTDVSLIKQNEIWQAIDKIEIVDRPPELATDGAIMVDVCVDVLKRFPNYREFCVLYPTAPLRTTEDVQLSYKLFVEGDYNGVIGATEFVQPWWQAFEKIRGNNTWRPAYPRLYELRTESLSTDMVSDNGAMYWMRTDVFLDQKTFFPNNLGVYTMPFERSIDVNTKLDFELAEFLASRKED